MYMKRLSPKLTLNFYCLMSLRKLVYCLSIYWLYEWPLVFISLHGGLSLLIAVSESCCHFVENRVNRIIQVIAESLLCVTLALLLSIYPELAVSQEVLEYTLMALHITFIFAVSILQVLRMSFAGVRWLVNRRRAKVASPYVLPQGVGDIEIIHNNSYAPGAPCYNNFFDQLSFKQGIQRLEESHC